MPETHLVSLTGNLKLHGKKYLNFSLIVLQFWVNVTQQQRVALTQRWHYFNLSSAHWLKTTNALTHHCLLSDILSFSKARNFLGEYE